MPLYQIKRITSAISLLFSLSLLIPTAQAQQTSGFLRNYNAFLTTNGQDYLVGRNRLGFDLSYETSYGTLFLSNEILNTYTTNANNYGYDFSEGYIDMYFSKSDLRVGKQVINQGRTDGAFITDIHSPIDLSEFLTQQVEDIKGAIPAVKYTRYYGNNFLEVIATPIFQSDMIARPESRWFPFKELDRNTNVVYADSSMDDTKALFQSSIKWGLRSSLKWDLDIYAMWWANSSPAYEKEFTLVGEPVATQPGFIVTKSYKRTSILAYSGNYVISDSWLLKSESAFHFEKQFDYFPEQFSEDDPSTLTPAEQQALFVELSSNDDGYLMDKPWSISMIGLQTSIAGITVSSQLFWEHIYGYDEEILQKQDFVYSTLLLQKSLLREKLTLYSFGRYNYSGNDFWINPRASYAIQDGLDATFGFHLFGGEETERLYGHFSFKDYAANSFTYLKLTAYF